GARMATTTVAPKTSERARILVAKVQAIEAAIKDAEEEARSLLASVEGDENSIVRLSADVVSKVTYLMRELGDDADCAFDLDFLTAEAADLVELCDLAESDRKSILA